MQHFYNIFEPRTFTCLADVSQLRSRIRELQDLIRRLKLSIRTKTHPNLATHIRNLHRSFSASVWSISESVKSLKTGF